MRTLYHLVRADVFERCRRYSFLVTLAAALYMAYAIYAGYVSMVTGNYRGVYNSAWLGTFISLATNLFVILAGFYIVKNAIDRDRKTGVGQILATTPISKFWYIVAKFISNFTVLMAIVVVQMIAALVMQVMKAEEPHIDFWILYSPFLYFTIPAMAFTAGLAVLFESITWLSKGFGNVVFFFLWIVLLMVPVENNFLHYDFSGIGIVQNNIQGAVKEKFPDYKGGFGINAGEHRDMDAYKTYVWNGIRWTPEIVGYRLAWFAYALALCLIGTLFFDRFDNARLPGMASVVKKKSGFAQRIARWNERFAGWTSFESFSLRSRFGQMFLAETRLMLKGVSMWWYLISITMIIVSLFVPMETLKTIFFPLIWVWPVLIWSKMGTREARNGTEQILFSAPHMLARQFPAILAAGVLLGLGAASGVLFRFIIAGDPLAAVTVVLGAIFIPSLALAFGVWSKSSKLFEAIYLLWWYIGPMNHVPEMDYTFTSVKSFSTGMPIVYIVMCGILLLAALSGRRRQMII
jgi:hypothetical protein